VTSLAEDQVQSRTEGRRNSAQGVHPPDCTRPRIEQDPERRRL